MNTVPEITALYRLKMFNLQYPEYRRLVFSVFFYVYYFDQINGHPITKAPQCQYLSRLPELELN